MVGIKLISFENKIAEIKCFPEGKANNNTFRLSLDIENQKIIRNSLNEKGNAYAIHAAWKMFDIYESTGSLPDTAMSIWC